MKKNKILLHKKLDKIVKELESNREVLALSADSLERIADSLQRMQETNSNKKYGNVVELKAETSKSLSACDLYHKPKESLCAVNAASNALPSETY